MSDEIALGSEKFSAGFEARDSSVFKNDPPSSVVAGRPQMRLGSASAMKMQVTTDGCPISERWYYTFGHTRRSEISLGARLRGEGREKGVSPASLNEIKHEIFKKFPGSLCVNY